MAQSPVNPFYSSLRSRRIRTLGVLFLLVAALMSFYGGTVLMPNLHRTLLASRSTSEPVVTSRGGPNAALPALSPRELRAARIRKVKVSLALAYWGVCSLFVIGAILMAWLDVREISQRYLDERRALQRETVDQYRREVLARDETSEDRRR